MLIPSPPQLYVLIDEPTLRQVKSDVVEAIEPQVEKLISEGEKAIVNMEKSVTSLQRKVGLTFVLLGRDF